MGRHRRAKHRSEQIGKRNSQHGRDQTAQHETLAERQRMRRRRVVAVAQPDNVHQLAPEHHGIDQPEYQRRANPGNQQQRRQRFGIRHFAAQDHFKSILHRHFFDR